MKAVAPADREPFRISWANHMKLDFVSFEKDEQWILNGGLK